MPWQFWVTIVLLALAGILAASSLIVARAPNAQQAFAKVAPYQGVLGLLALVWGLYTLIQLLTNFGGFQILLSIIAILLLIVLGLLLGYGLLKTYLLKGEASAKGDEVQQRLARNQVTYGVAAVVVAILLLIVAL